MYLCRWGIRLCGYGRRLSLVYIDYDFYSEYYGETLPSEETDRIFKIASEIIDILTGYKIRRMGFDKLDSFTKEQVKLAAAAEADYYRKNGDFTDNDGSEAVQMTLGKFSYMNSSGTGKKNNFPVSPVALSCLETTGLLCRRTEVM